MDKLRKSISTSQCHTARNKPSHSHNPAIRKRIQSLIHRHSRNSMMWRSLRIKEKFTIFSIIITTTSIIVSTKLSRTWRALRSWNRRLRKKVADNASHSIGSQYTLRPLQTLGISSRILATSKLNSQRYSKWECTVCPSAGKSHPARCRLVRP